MPTPAQFAGLAILFGVLGFAFGLSAMVVLKREGRIWKTVWALEAGMFSCFLGAVIATLLGLAAAG